MHWGITPPDGLAGSGREDRSRAGGTAVCGEGGESFKRGRATREGKRVYRPWSVVTTKDKGQSPPHLRSALISSSILLITSCIWVWS